MSREKTLSIALGSADARHSCVWNVRVHKSDIYISSQSTSGQTKVSLHEDGNCKCGFSSEFWKNKGLPNSQRHWQQWHVDTSTEAKIAFAVKIASIDMFAEQNAKPGQNIEWWSDLPTQTSMKYHSY